MAGRVATCPRMTTPNVPSIDLETFASLPKHGVTVLDFTAAACGPCRTLMPILDALAGEYARHLRIVAVDVDHEQALAEQFSIRAMPTLVILRDGREVGRVIGSRSRGFLRGVLDRALAGDVAIAAP
jgi:thioredoxin 1